MTVTIDGTTGVSKVQDGSITADDFAAGAVTPGITEADIWALTSDTSSGLVGPYDFTANVSRATADGAGYFGTGMSWSAGVFTFPSTGIYEVVAHFSASADTSSLVYLGPRIHVSADSGSNYNVRESKYQTSSVTSGHMSPQASVILDVNDASAFRVYFSLETSAQVDIFSSSTATQGTYFRFIRLGDT
mgnify:CR=1 FL=1